LSVCMCVVHRYIQVFLVRMGDPPARRLGRAPEALTRRGNPPVEDMRRATWSRRPPCGVSLASNHDATTQGATLNDGTGTRSGSARCPSGGQCDCTEVLMQDEGSRRKALRGLPRTAAQARRFYSATCGLSSASATQAPATECARCRGRVWNAGMRVTIAVYCKNKNTTHAAQV
jgi:hypothetical protein